MISRRLILTAGLLLAFTAPLALAQGAASPETSATSGQGLYALFHTTAGDFACRLFEDRTYQNIRNFLDLACGYRVWTDPHSGDLRRVPYYDGLPIYHVARNAMIVGGDPLENGQGSPGYFIGDEIHDDLTFDLPGRLAMANWGGQPDTNSGTWFVTIAPLPELNGRNTIIGEIVQGMDVVLNISRVEADAAGRPLEEITVERIDIIRVLSGGQVVAFERSNARPFAALDDIPSIMRTSSLPTWTEPGEAAPRVALPALPPICGPLPD